MSILQEILRKRLETRAQPHSLTELKTRALDLPPPRNFLHALDKDKIVVIAEIKFRSPSEGLLRNGNDVGFITESYAKNGAAALSVLTELHSFGGTLENINRAKKVCALPVLRKDFLYDEYDIWESKISGADAILLIAKMLTHDQLHELRGIAKQASLAILLELHDEDDLKKAEGLSDVAFGVNHRNLETLTINLEISSRLFPFIKGLIVAESGLRSHADLLLMQERGANAVLVGTSFMKHNDPGQALAAFLA